MYNAKEFHFALAIENSSMESSHSVWGCIHSQRDWMLFCVALFVSVFLCILYFCVVLNWYTKHEVWLFKTLDMIRYTKCCLTNFRLSFNRYPSLTLSVSLSFQIFFNSNLVVYSLNAHNENFPSLYFCVCVCVAR